MAPASAISIARRRPKRSDTSPKTIPPTIAPTIEMADNTARGCRRHMPGPLQERRVHILRAMRGEVHPHHEQGEVKEQLPLAGDGAAQS